MKISDGNWLIQEHLDVINPVYFFQAAQTDRGLEILVAPKAIHERQYQLDVAMFTYTFDALQPDTIRVRMEHHRGRQHRKPDFPLSVVPVKMNIIEDDEYIHLRNGHMSVVLHKKGAWQVDFYYDDQYLTASGVKDAGYAKDKRNSNSYVFEQLNLGVGELIYGLGERFGPLVKNGQIVDVWNRDGGTSTEQSYKNVPFYLSNRGYGIFVDQTDLVSLEVASEKVSKVQFSVKSESLTYHVIGGNTPKQVLTNYTALTGRSPRLPAWSYGLWLSTSFTTDYDEGTVTGFIKGMEERNIPLHVFHFDCFWMEALKWCDFSWDKNVFPQPHDMLKRLKNRGLHICVWINPYISQQSSLFQEGMEKGYFIKTIDGDVWQWDRWQPGLAIVDFTNPQACQWYTGYLERLLDMGVDCFKTDFGERIPSTGVRYYDGSDPEKMHNFYTYLYNKTVFDLLQHKKGEGEAILFARSATACGQTMPVHWGGDCHGTYESMAETLRGGLSLGLSGFGFWSHDIGGFENTSPADVYKRWCAFGLFSSHSRLHGSQSYRVPWAYDQEAVDVLRHFTQWKCRLMPYIYQLAEEAHFRGIPVLRAMMLEFPDDPSCDYLDRQYMLGDTLLVAPVMYADGNVKFYLPAGTWTHLFSGTKVQGSGWLTEHYDFLSLPLFIRENHIVPIGSNFMRPDYEYTEQVTFYLPSLQDHKTAKVKVTSLDRSYVTNVSVHREGNIYRATFQDLHCDCQIRLPANIYSVSQGQAELLSEKNLWKINKDTKLVVFCVE